jgi:flagellar biosynthesis/type III secretory pathway ATPase
MIDFADAVEQSLSGLRTPQPQRSGTLVRLVGMTLEARGVMAPLGACCEVVGRHCHRVEAEVVGFNDKTLFLMPFTDPVGVGPGDMDNWRGPGEGEGRASRNPVDGYSRSGRAFERTIDWRYS